MSETYTTPKALTASVHPHAARVGDEALSILDEIDAPLPPLPQPKWPIGGNPAHPEYIHDPTSKTRINRNTQVPKHHKNKTRPTTQAITRHGGVNVSEGEEEPAPTRGELPTRTLTSPALFSDYLPDAPRRAFIGHYGSHPRGNAGVNRFR